MLNGERLRREPGTSLPDLGTIRSRSSKETANPNKLARPAPIAHQVAIDAGHTMRSAEEKKTLRKGNLKDKKTASHAS